jgi:hypothetical protein
VLQHHNEDRGNDQDDRGGYGQRQPTALVGYGRRN